MRYQILILLSALIFSCTSKQDETPVTTIQISANSPEDLIPWYISNLGLTRSSLPNELKVSGPGFEIIFAQTNIDRPEGRTQGFFKYGFATNQLDQIYELMQANGVTFRGEPFYDENLKARSLVTLDSEGNRVQLFEDPDANTLTPNFFAVMTNNFESVKTWYEERLGFKEEFNLDLEERNIKVRLLKNEQWMLELISIPSINEIPNNSPGIVGIELSSRPGLKDSDGNLVSY